MQGLINNHIKNNKGKLQITPLKFGGVWITP